MKHWLSGLLFSTIFAPCFGQTAPRPVGPLPENRQVNWQRKETTAFIHFGLNTFNDKEWGYGDSDPETFNPTSLDCEQWVKTFKAAGIKQVIITAKHHDGFCIWPTLLTEYCIRNTPYKKGKGDIVGELEAACRKYNIDFGVYLSPWDRNTAVYGTSAYVEYYYKQLKELLTGYGKISEVWFDGANGGDGYYGGAKETRKIDRRHYYNFPRLIHLIDNLHPNAIVFGDGGPGCRWIGNERGVAGATNWSLLRSKEVFPGYEKYYELTYGHADGDKWVPGECDVSIRPGWFYHSSQDNQVKTVNDLVELYYQSVGHNALLLLNFPVDRKGLIFSTDSINAVNFHKQILKELKTDLLRGRLAVVTNTRGGKYGAKALTDGLYDTYWATEDNVVKANVTFTLPKEEKVNRLLLQEYIPLGQRVKSFVIEYLNKGKWQVVNPHEETTTIGYKRIVRFETISTSKLRVRFLDARGPLCMNTISAFYSGNDNAFGPIVQKHQFESKSFTLLNVKSTEVAKVFDKNEQTVCHIPSKEVVIDLGKEIEVRELDMLPDQSVARKGLITNYEIYTTSDAQKGNRKLIAQGEFSNIQNNPIRQSVYFSPVRTRYLILKAIRLADNSKETNIAELGVR